MGGEGEQLLLLLGLAALLMFVYWRPRWSGGGTAFGTARWCHTDRDLRPAGMIGGAGLPLGRTRDTGELVALPDFCHTVCFAGTGRGKGVSLILPALYTYPGACVVLDIKGELWRLTAKWRESRFGHRVVRLDPFGVNGPGGDTLNPLDLLGAGPEAVDDARALADALVVRTGEEKEPFWQDMAASILAAATTLVLTATEQGDRHLGCVREILCDPLQYEGMVKLMRDGQGVFRRLGGQLAHLEDKTKSSALASADSHSLFLDSPLVDACVRSSSFPARELRQGRTTVYLTVPVDKVSSHNRLIRLWVATFIRLLMREGMEGGRTCLFVLDEAGVTLEHMRPLEAALVAGRGAGGIRLLLAYQSYDQARAAFAGKENVIMDNCDTRLFWGVASHATAKAVSEMAGESTEELESATENEGESFQRGGTDHAARGVQVSRGRTLNRSEHGRALMKLEEVLTMDDRDLLVFHRSMPPMRLRRLISYQDALFREAVACAKRAAEGAGGGVPPWAWALLLAAAGALLWLLAQGM